MGLCSRALGIHKSYIIAWICAPEHANPWGDSAGMTISDFGSMRKGGSISRKRGELGSCALGIWDGSHVPWIRAPKRANPWENGVDMSLSSSRG